MELLIEFCFTAFPGFSSLQVGSDVCFYISEQPRYPFQKIDDLAHGVHGAQDSCAAIGLELAVVKDANELDALINVASELFLILPFS